MPRLKKIKRCEPDCPHGMGIFNDPVYASGILWLQIEKCDDCHFYLLDDEAAVAAALAGGSMAFYIDLDTGDMYPVSDPGSPSPPDTKVWLNKRRAAGQVRIFIPADAAKKAGLISASDLEDLEEALDAFDYSIPR
jgi:hypothetical protein